MQPEYVRGIPGGLKNALDWLVSGDQIVGRPIALVHASHLGEDMLQALRAVLSRVSSALSADLFLRVPVLGLEPQQVADVLRSESHREKAQAFLHGFAKYAVRLRSVEPCSSAWKAVEHGSTLQKSNAGQRPALPGCRYSAGFSV